MTMKQFSTEAQTAHDHLVPLLDQAISHTNDRLEKAKQAASPEALRPDLLAMLDNADTPAADAIGGIIGGYAQLMPNHRARDGGLLIRSLVSTKSHHGLTDDQAGQIAGAIIGAIQGKAHSGLIEWPENWHDELHHNDLCQWCEWVAPKAYGDLLASLQDTTKARISAESDLVQLQASQQALADLVPSPSTGAVIQIRNNAENRQGVAGIHWQAGEVKTLEPAEYAQVIDNAGYQRLADAGQFEVLA
ncbi:hypothetical protein LG325_11905 [Marinobacter nauticus]